MNVPKTVIDYDIDTALIGKKRTTRRTGLVSILVCLALSSPLVFTLLPMTGSGAPDTWTFMVYMNADNNLEDQGILDFLEMSSVSNASNLNIVVQFDRYAGGGYPDDTSYGN